MASRAAGSYKASVETGLMPSWKILCFAVFGEIPSSLAISLTVKNSFPLTSITQFIGRESGKHDKYTQKVEMIDKCLVKIIGKSKEKYLSGINIIDVMYPAGILLKYTKGQSAVALPNPATL
jgi:hypothetical protein